MQARHDSHVDTIEELERYRMLVESVKDYAIFLLDTEGYVASWNLGAERFKGYKPQEIIGKHFSTFYTKRDLDNDKPARELKESKLHGRVEDEGWRVRKDGSQFWASVVITALYDKAGKHVGFAKVTRDLTERKLYEDNLRDANKKLETSYKELQVLSAAKDEFVSLASHQLRTPATGVKQYLGLLLEGYAGELTDQQIDFLRKAYNSNDRQIEIVNDLLQVAQLDAGKIVLNKETVDVSQLVQDVIDEQVDSFKARGQHVVLYIPTKTTVAAVDPVRFRMVLENLIDNASKYTPTGGEVTITIAAEGPCLQVSVADTGVGIAKKDIAKLFEKFNRIPNALSQTVTGSGLGLYWVRKVVQLHGGTITVTSKPGRGSVFTVSVPLDGAGGVDNAHA